MENQADSGSKTPYDIGRALSALGGAIWTNAKIKGFYDEPRTFGDCMALIHSEVSESLEEFRAGHHPQDEYFEVREAFKVNNVSFNPNDRLTRPEYDAAIADDAANIAKLKPMGVPSEFADILIRLLDNCHEYGINIGAAVETKMLYNATRPRMHGKTL